jgi:hypothetical protein
VATKFILTAWNIEWLGRLMQRIENPDISTALRDRLRQRLNGVYQAIREIDSDILCVTEGPPGETGIDAFASGLAGYSAVKRVAGESYHQRGNQWIWFLVKDALLAGASLLPVPVWRQYTKQASPGGEHVHRWPVYRWGNIVQSSHSHYRHPQALVLSMAGLRVEFIGVHLKSKLTTTGDFFSPDDNRRRAFIQQTVENRMKLATESQNIRYYIDHRFSQEPAPAVFVLGDLNDGPGKELIERQFLFFDLLDNVQGDVFEAGKFLNHALFDYPDHLRWSVRFADRIDPTRDPQILLDHIMFTQPLVRGQIPLQVESGAGRVEHEIFDRLNSQLPSGESLSDHKPVSCELTVN